jgi:pentatricopeptide repeat protein
VIESAEGNGLEATLLMYVHTIEAAVLGGKLSAAIDLFHNMQSRGIPVTADAINAFMLACNRIKVYKCVYAARLASDPAAHLARSAIA